MKKSDIENKIFEVVKEKTSCRGYWKDETGKLYKDNIKLYKAENALDFENKVNDLFFKGEKCVFSRGVNRAYLIYPLLRQEELRQYTQVFITKLKSSIVKKMLKENNGLTVYRLENGYLLETWSY